MIYSSHKHLPVSVVVGIILSMSIVFFAYAGQIDTPKGKKRVIVYNDGHYNFTTGKFHNAESLKANPQTLSNTNVWIYQWGVMIGTTVNYPSKVAGICGSGLSAETLNQVREGDRKAATILSQLAGDGVDTLQSIAQGCHEAGILCYADIRANACYPLKAPGWTGDSLARMYNDKFWWDHQEFLIADKSGKQSPNMPNLSYAFPEVRELKLAIVREVVQRDVDGINIDFLRHPPFFGYEAPLINGFKKKYGIDPRSLPNDDKRWYAYRCDVMTDFMRKVRLIVDKAGSEKKRKLGISARIDNRHYQSWGLDIETWIKEGVLDILIVGQHGAGGYSFDLRPFVKMASGTGCLVFVSEEATTAGHDPTPQNEIDRKAGKPLPPKMSTLMNVQDFSDRARKWYSQGAVGIQLFNDSRPEVLNVLGEQSQWMNKSPNDDKLNKKQYR